MFGSTTENFDLNHIKRMFEIAQMLSNKITPLDFTSVKVLSDFIDEIKAYTNSYFAKTCEPINEIVIYDHTKKTFSSQKSDNVLKAYFDKSDFNLYKGVEKTPVFSLKKWFFKEDCDLYKVVFDVELGKVGSLPGGGNYINLFGGLAYIFDETKESKSKHAMDGVELIWKHIEEVICSSDIIMFKYVRMWFIHVLNLKRTKTCLYWKSPQGTGKSAIVEFICKILGSCSLVTGCTNIFDKNHIDNSQLRGKLFVNLNEPSTSTPKEWMALAGNIKADITEDTLQIAQKNVSHVVVKNYMNVIITTNTNAIKFEESDRRFPCCDISNHRMGDTEYFKTLFSYLENENVQQAFYNEAINSFEKFDFTKIPDSKARSTLKTSALPPLATFIMERYIKSNELSKEEYNVKFKGEARVLVKQQLLRQDYENWARQKNIHISANYTKEIGSALEKLNLFVIIYNGGGLYVDMLGRNGLYELYKKNKWFHDSDEIDACTCEVKEGKCVNCQSSCMVCYNKLFAIMKKTEYAPKTKAPKVPKASRVPLTKAPKAIANVISPKRKLPVKATSDDDEEANLFA